MNSAGDNNINNSNTHQNLKLLLDWWQSFFFFFSIFPCFQSWRILESYVLILQPCKLCTRSEQKSIWHSIYLQERLVRDIYSQDWKRKNNYMYSKCFPYICDWGAKNYIFVSKAVSLLSLLSCFSVQDQGSKTKIDPLLLLQNLSH